MNTVFIGGSRHISRLSSAVRERIDNVIANGFLIIVGDANGADKAVQKYLFDVSYDKVRVFCSGENCRNNIGQWPMNHVKTANPHGGFHFYAAKDKEMAHEADFGLMIWDGKSPGTVLNVLRLARDGKKAVLYDTPKKQFIDIKSIDHWNNFISQCADALRNALRERATPEEKMLIQQQPSLLDLPSQTESMRQTESLPLNTDEELTAYINSALATGDSTAVVNALGNVARTLGMSKVAKDSGLARESLYRSLSADGNPEFATVLKVMDSMGLRLMVSKGH